MTRLFGDRERELGKGGGRERGGGWGSNNVCCPSFRQGLWLYYVNSFFNVRDA